MPNTFDTGDLVRLSVAFTNAAGSPTDPTTTTVKYRKPDQTLVAKVNGTDVEVVKDSAGNFHIDIAITQAGTWRYRWIGTGAVETAAEGTFNVRDPGAA